MDVLYSSQWCGHGQGAHAHIARTSLLKGATCMKLVRSVVFLLMVGVLMALLAAQGVAQASSVSTSSQRTLTVRAFIDGRSTLVLRGNTVHWFHADFAAPGRHNGVNFATFLNDTAWFPTWPDVPTA